MPTLSRQTMHLCCNYDWKGSIAPLHPVRDKSLQIFFFTFHFAADSISLLEIP